MSEIPRLTITIKEARQASGLSHGQIYEALNCGLLDSRKVLGRRLIIYSSLVRLLLARADARPPSAFAQILALMERSRASLANESRASIARAPLARPRELWPQNAEARRALRARPGSGKCL